MSWAFQPLLPATEASATPASPGTFDTGIFDRNIFDNVLGPLSAKTVTASAGSYAITGTAATLRHAWKVPAGAGSYAITGSAAALRKAWKVTAASGSYTVTGTAATLRHAWRTTAGAGSYSVTGTAAGLKAGKRVTAAAGSYAVTGVAATLRHAWRVTAASGSYSITGQDATLTKAGSTAKTLTADAGSYAITGQPATLLQSAVPATGGNPIWKGPIERKYRVHPEYEDKPAKPKRKKVREPEVIELAPDLHVETGIVPVRPAWDVMAEMQQRAAEAEQARQDRFRAIAQADDEWLMVA